MKKLPLIIITFIFFGISSSFSQVETVPAEYIIKQVQIPASNQAIRLITENIFKPVVNAGWDEGVAAFKGAIDPKFKPPVKGWIRDSMFLMLKNHYHLIEFQDGDDYFLRSAGTKGVLPTIPTVKAVPVKGNDPTYMFVYFELPKGKTINKRGSFDLLYAYDLNPNDLSFIGDKLPKAMIAKAKKNPSYLKRVFGLTLIQRPAQPYKIYVGNLPKLYIDGDFGPATELKTTGDIQNFSASDDEIRAAKKTADAFLKSIRSNNLAGFSQHFPVASEDELVAVRSKTKAKDLFNQYRQLPEYLSHELTFEKTVVIDQNGCVVNRDEVSKVIADDVVINLKDKILVAVYRLPEGRKASQLRAPTDILNNVLFPAGDGIVVVDLERIKFEKTPKKFYSTIIGGPIIGTLIGKGNHPENYISVILHKNPNTSNFNLGVILEKMATD